MRRWPAAVGAALVALVPVTAPARPVAPVAAQVSFDALRAAEETPEHWLTYSGSYRSQRFSRLDRITKENVSRLRPVWTREFEWGPLQATPLVADGVLYSTGPPSTVVALDARTGRELWRHESVGFEEVVTVGSTATNRGVALLGDRVFVGTLDARLLALDARDGAVRWSAPVADNRHGYTITGAPLAVEGKVIVGVSGGDVGARGFLDAYDAGTGERAWRFWTVPAPGEPGADTWEGDSWKTGGGATWLTGSYDPDPGLLYWGVGNPAPVLNGEGRAGDNLYTASLIALEAATGALQWHFQFTPHDTHDWDANQIPVLVDAEWEGVERELVVISNKNAFLYVLDRRTGEFLRGEPFAKQTWAEGLDENGRPIPAPGMEPSEEGTLVWPCELGAANWYSPAYDPERGTLFLRVLEEGCRYFRDESEYRPGVPVEYEPGNSPGLGGGFLGGRYEWLEVEEAYGAVRAFDLATGALSWEYRQRLPSRFGVLATATGLVFSGAYSGRVFALDADSGEILWNFRTGLSASDGGNGPISFALDGEQFVTVTAGRTLFTFGLPDEAPNESRPARK